ncbi:MAG: Bifunctional ligase/repressor BirA [Betaproteobacteria bacterium ADurb.Bin341]|nr:MAG: Bifunctional ligase/repressor BirA [Betaproteobacteria bacterium ADurb.Bin341]
MPLIDPATLQPLLTAVRGRFDVDSIEECDSTNTVLMRRAGEGAPSGTVLVADFQSAGRGRRGRSWTAAPESGLLFSLLWRFNRTLADLCGLSLAIGVAVTEALEALGARGVGVKWPNDLLFQDTKLAGILVELASDPRGTLAIIGIGLNLHTPDGDLPQPACGLDAVLHPVPDRHTLLAKILTTLAPTLDHFDAEGFAALQARWQHYHAWQDRQVDILGDSTGKISGACLGADQDGALLLSTPEGIRRFLSGEISLRKKGSPC